MIEMVALIAFLETVEQVRFRGDVFGSLEACRDEAARRQQTETAPRQFYVCFPIKESLTLQVFVPSDVRSGIFGPLAEDVE